MSAWRSVQSPALMFLTLLGLIQSRASGKGCLILTILGLSLKEFRVIDGERPRIHDFPNSFLQSSVLLRLSAKFCFDAGQ
jgi:hypothetical protein